MRSMRIPFGRFLYVGGKRLIIWKSSEPPETPELSKVKTKELLEFGAAMVGVNV